MLLQLRRGFKCLLCFGWKKIWSKHWDLRCRQNYRNPPLINSQRQILIFSEPTFTFSNKLSLQQKAGGGDDPNTSEGTKLFSTITSNHCHLIHHPFSLSLSLQGADNPRTTFHVHKGEFDGHTMKTGLLRWLGGSMTNYDPSSEARLWWGLWRRLGGLSQICFQRDHGDSTGGKLLLQGIFFTLISSWSW